jgi:hypothetical protein
MNPIASTALTNSLFFARWCVGPTQIAPSRDLASADETDAGCPKAATTSNDVTDTGLTPPCCVAFRKKVKTRCPRERVDRQLQREIKSIAPSWALEGQAD